MPPVPPSQFPALPLNQSGSELWACDVEGPASSCSVEGWLASVLPLGVIVQEMQGKGELLGVEEWEVKARPAQGWQV